MASRPTIQDVALESGVSVATVDRVLNARTKVREETARRVYDAAVKIGYHAAGLIKQRIDIELPEYRLGILLHKEKQEFYKHLYDVLLQTAESFEGARIKLDILFLPSQTPAEYAKGFLKLGKTNQAVAGISLDHHDVTLAVETLKNQGVATYSLLSDFAQGVRQDYIGLNNLRVGRVTARLISKFARPGKVALFVGGHRWHGHELRETGFRSYFREYAPEFTVLETLVNLETRQLTYEATLDLLEHHQDLTGLYCAGGGMEGAIMAVRELRKPEDIAFAVNEDTPDTRRALQDHYLSFANITPVEDMCKVAIRQMVDGIENGISSTLGQHFIPQSFLFPEMF